MIRFTKSDLDWPDDQRYFCRCLKCDAEFAGPKRAPFCWPHMQESDQKHAERKAALEAEYGPYIHRTLWRPV